MLHGYRWTFVDPPELMFVAMNVLAHYATPSERTDEDERYRRSPEDR